MVTVRMGITAADRTGQTVELAFDIRDRDCFFVDVSANEACRVELEHLAHRSDGRLLEFFTVEGASADRVLTMAAACPAISDARLVSEGVGSELFEFLVSGRCVTSTLADAGAITRSVSAENGHGRVVADVPPHVEVRTVVERFSARYERTNLAARRERDRPIPIRTKHGAQAMLGDHLTEKQLEVLRTAYLSGYFRWPRERTAEECAAALGISQPTFSQHIRVAQAKVFDAFFGDDGVDRRRLPDG